MDLGAKQFHPQNNSSRAYCISHTEYNILRLERCTPDSDVIEKLSNINILVTIYTMYLTPKGPDLQFPVPNLISLTSNWVLGLVKN